MSTGALLTIITGTPGTGKTALAVKMIKDFLDVNPERPVYAAGINGLKLPHLKVPPRDEWAEPFQHPDDPSITAFRFTFPPGSLVVIDEAHDFFPMRGAGSRVPPYTAAMKTHRHLGIDFILMTQGPGFLDPEIRGLCGKYIHLRDHWSGRKLHEWAEVVDPKATSSRARATTLSYKIPKEVYSLYKSSSMHVKRDRRLPNQVWLFVLLLLVASFLGYRTFSKISSSIQGEPEPEEIVEASPSATQVDPVPRAPRAVTESTVETLGTHPDHYSPRMPQRPETAPLYDTIRQVKTMPTVAGCVASATRCKCYTGQGTDAFLTDEQCRAWIENPPFDPWRDPSLPNQQTPGAAALSRQDGPNPVGAAPPSGAGVS